MRNVSFIIALGLLIFGCSPKVINKYSYDTTYDIVPIDSNEIIISNDLKDYFKKGDQRKIVVRVNNASQSIVKDENVDYVTYNIEKSLLKAGFDVKDRSLLQEVYKSQDRYEEYKKIGQITGADLILEIQNISYVLDKNKTKAINLDLSSPGCNFCKENTWTDEKYAKQSFQPQDYSVIPVFIFEAKLIIIKDGKIGGAFKIMSTPSQIIKDMKYKYNIQLFEYNRMSRNNDLRYNYRTTYIPESHNDYYTITRSWDSGSKVSRYQLNIKNSGMDEIIKYSISNIIQELEK